MRFLANTLRGFTLIGVALTSAGLHHPAWAQPATVGTLQKLSDTAGNFTATIDNEDEFGGAVAGLGDLDGAGPSVVALAAGAGGDDDGGPDRGAVHILFLAANGSTLSQQKISDTAGNFTAIIDNADDFGGSIAYLGDLDGAGPSVAALAVGAPADDDGGLDRGAVYILFLNSAGSVLSFQKISDTAGSFTATIDNADEFGGAITFLGDLDGAGPSAGAIAVGAIGDDDGGTNRGAVYVLFLSSAGSTLSFSKISDLAGNFTPTIDNADEIGSSVASLGDLDGAGPGAAALAMGAIGDDDGGTDRGAVYILFLNTAGSVLSHQKISNTSGNFTAVLDNLDEFGGSLAYLGDIDNVYGPSVAGLAVGAVGDDDGGASHGAVYVLFLRSTGSVLSHQKISDTLGNFTPVLDTGDEFGGGLTTLGTFGMDPNGVQTLVGGAGFDDDGGLDRGAVYVMTLQRTRVSDANPTPGAPRNFLGLARPNPFNPATQIPFTIAAASWVEIDIVNARGQRVRTLVAGAKPAGTHELTWNGLDDGGNRLASGAYFYRLSVDGSVQDATEKMVLLK